MPRPSLFASLAERIGSSRPPRADPAAKAREHHRARLANSWQSKPVDITLSPNALDIGAEIGDWRMLELGPNMRNWPMNIIMHVEHVRTAMAGVLKMPSPAYLARNPRARARFEHELIITGKANHPHIVAVLEASEIGNMPYFVLPRYAADLNECTTRELLTRQEIWAVLTQIASGLAYLHEEHGVIHGDIKPYNVMVEAINDRNKQAKIIDLNTTRPLGSVDTEVIRTPAYMAPWSLPELPATTATDLYAFVITIGDLLYSKRISPILDAIGAEEEPEFGQVLANSALQDCLRNDGSLQSELVAALLAVLSKQQIGLPSLRELEMLLQKQAER